MSFEFVEPSWISDIDDSTESWLAGSDRPEGSQYDVAYGPGTIPGLEGLDNLSEPGFWGLDNLSADPETWENQGDSSGFFSKLFDKGGILGSDSSIWKGIGAGVDIADYLDRRGMTKDELALNRDKFNAEKDMYNNYLGNLDEVIDYINQKQVFSQGLLNRNPAGPAPQLKPFTVKTLASGGGLSAIADQMRGPEVEEMEEEDDMPPGGQDDLIPALVAEGEFFFDADTVSAIGDGSTEAGIARLEQFRENIRKQKRAAPIDEIPPKTRPLESYMRGKA